MTRLGVDEGTTLDMPAGRSQSHPRLATRCHVAIGIKRLLRVVEMGQSYPSLTRGVRIIAMHA
jgi:hypothetical protein